MRRVLLVLGTTLVVVVSAGSCMSLLHMDRLAQIRAAEIELRRAILRNWPRGPERRAWQSWADRPHLVGTGLCDGRVAGESAVDVARAMEHSRSMLVGPVYAHSL
jgi:hypothetical protein